MFYKSILNAVAVVVAVMAVMFVGCGGDDNPAGGGGGGLEGDWLIKERRAVLDGMEDRVGVSPIIEKELWSFKASKDLVITVFWKYDNFWIESDGGPALKYTTKGDSLCLVFEGGIENCIAKYGVTGNTLTLTGPFSTCINDDCQYGKSIMKYEKDDIAKTKRDLGNNLKHQDQAVVGNWVGSPEEGKFSEIMFHSNYYDGGNVYLDSYNAVWYSENSQLFLLEYDCNETTEDGYYGGDQCVSYSVTNTVTLDYQLTNGTLLLRPVGSAEWNEWTLFEYEYSQSKAKDKYAVSPFWAFRR